MVVAHEVPPDVKAPALPRTHTPNEKQPPSNIPESASTPAQPCLAQVCSSKRPMNPYDTLAGMRMVRFMKLHPSLDSENQVTCSLATYDLDVSIPRYSALSYVWGSAVNPARICINGRQRSVTRNLYDALLNLRDHFEEKLLWVDAICINQHNISERNQQVRLMRDIYAEATEVVSYLGPATPALDSGSADDIVLDIASRPYWQRVWIIQEFVLAKRNVLQCGEKRFDLESLLSSASPNLRKRSRNLPNSPSHTGSKPLDKKPTAQRSSSLTESEPVTADNYRSSQMHSILSLQQMFFKSARGIPFRTALDFADHAQATDPRDKIYGILGISTEVCLQPDYTLSLCQVKQLAWKPKKYEVAVGDNIDGTSSGESKNVPDGCRRVGHKARQSCEGFCGVQWDLDIMVWPRSLIVTTMPFLGVMGTPTNALGKFP